MKVLEVLDVAWWKIKSLYKWFTPSRFWAKWRLLFTLGILVLIFHVTILQAIGGFLINTDKMPDKVDAIFVLGGNTFDRSNHAAELYFEGLSKNIVTVGANEDIAMKTIFPDTSNRRIRHSDCFISRDQLILEGVSEDHIRALDVGTSTREEANAILNYCKQNGYEKIVVVSGKFHTRRMSYSFKDFDDHEIEVLLSGSSHSDYDEDYWWKSEGGMIMVNNEYMKLLYYYLNY